MSVDKADADGWNQLAVKHRLGWLAPGYICCFDNHTLASFGLPRCREEAVDIPLHDLSGGFEKLAPDGRQTAIMPRRHEINSAAGAIPVLPSGPVPIELDLPEALGRKLPVWPIVRHQPAGSLATPK